MMRHSLFRCLGLALFGLLLALPVSPARAQMGATPDNANKLTFEALTATPPPPRPRPIYHPVYRGSSRGGRYGRGETRGHGQARGHGGSAHESRREAPSRHGSSSHHATTSTRRRR